jgi:hypothetical protein
VRFIKITPPSFASDCYQAEAELLRYLNHRSKESESKDFEDRFRLGVGVQNLTPELADYYGIRTPGVLVTEVLEGLPAAAAGLKPQDIILEVNGKAVKSTQALQQMIAEKRGPQRLTIKYWRSGYYRLANIATIPQASQPSQGPIASKPQVISPAQPEDKTPPVITIFEPAQARSIKVTTDKYNLNIKGAISDPSGVASAEINGRPLTLDAQGHFQTKITLTAGQNQAVIRAADTVGNVAEKIIAIDRSPRPADTKKAPGTLGRQLKPTLWVLAIGISEYQNPNINLRFAAQDANAIAQVLKKRGGTLYDEINIKTLTNDQATRTNIIMAMERFLGQAAQGDVVLIFMAGHGVKHKTTGSYYFLTHHADGEHLVGQALRWSDFDEMIKILHRNVDKIVLMIDTCHAGSIKVALRSGSGGENLAALMLKAQGLYTLAASKSGEESMESEKFKASDQSPGNGAFTFAIVKGLQGEANYNEDDYISVMEVFNYVGKVVPRLTEGRQHPYTKMAGTDMPLVAAD